MFDLWKGKYILLYADGTPLGLASGFSPYKADSPNDVTFWTDLEEARNYATLVKHEVTVHRVERLSVLQERFTY